MTEESSSTVFPALDTLSEMRRGHDLFNDSHCPVFTNMQGDYSVFGESSTGLDCCGL